MSINFANVTYKTMIDNFAKTISKTPVTKTTSNVSGQETLTSGTPVNISGAFFRKEDAWAQNKEGLFQGADAIFMANTDVVFNKNDILSYDNEDYRILKTIERKLGTTHFYNMGRCFKI